MKGMRGPWPCRKGPLPGHWETRRKGLQGARTRESPGPDAIGPHAVWPLFDCKPERIVAVIRAHLRLGVHPGQWKTARGVTIFPKPVKPDYGLAKAYRVISLLNFLGKMVEKVAAYLISNQCEHLGCFHPGQYGSRPQRSAVDAVGLAIAKTRGAWSQGQIAGALLMDVEAAFPSAARSCLLHKMREMKLDEDLVR